jgi:hypothetical protein
MKGFSIGLLADVLSDRVGGIKKNKKNRNLQANPISLPSKEGKV